MGLSSREVISADNSLNWSQAGVLDNISKPAGEAREQPKPQPALKCPRCESTNTKFCYYNNYSRMQPRHLCRACKRHWTAGGTLRSVPVGGGRKNKRARTDSGAKIAKDDDNLASGSTCEPQQQLPFSLAYETDFFPDVLSQVLSLPPLLPSTPLLLHSDYSNIESPVSPYAANSLSSALSCSHYKEQELGREENSVVRPNKWVQESPELSLSYWNCWDGITELGIQDLGCPDREGLH